VALSADLLHWQRLGLATFGRYHGIEIGDVDDKDASLFPVALPNPSGHPELAMLHRPLFPGTRPEETACHPATRDVDLDRESIWISYCGWPWRAVNQITSAILPVITGWRLRCRPGSGSKSAAALRPS